MSHHTLSRKHKAKKNISVGSQFSTMGVRRYHYYIGDNRLNKYNKCPQTIGTVPLLPPKTTSGLLASRVHFPTKICDDGTPASYNWVMSFNPEEHAQSNYIHKVKVAASCNDHVIKDAGSVSCDAECSETTMIGGKTKSRSTFHKNVNVGAVSSSQYTNVNIYHKKCLPTPPCKQPFPFIINQNGCNKYYLTPEEAISDGALPSNWMNCDTHYAFKKYPG